MVLPRTAVHTRRVPASSLGVSFLVVAWHAMRYGSQGRATFLAAQKSLLDAAVQVSLLVLRAMEYGARGQGKLPRCS